MEMNKISIYSSFFPQYFIFVVFEGQFPVVHSPIPYSMLKDCSWKDLRDHLLYWCLNPS